MSNPPENHQPQGPDPRHLGQPHQNQQGGPGYQQGAPQQGGPGYQQSGPGYQQGAPQQGGPGYQQGAPQQGGQGYQQGGPGYQQGGPGYQQGGQGYQGPPAPGKTRNIIAIVALVLAVLGLIFAVWEGAYLVGWILLPIAFILSIVALVQRGKAKKMAVAALVISIVGTIAGAVAFTSSAVKIIDEAIKSEVTVSPATTEPATTEPAQTVTSTPLEETPEPTAEVTEPTTEPEPTVDETSGGETGSRANPSPLGSSVTSEEWEVTVNSFTPDATAAVLAENMFNEEPEAGSTYALVNLTIKRLAAESGYSGEVSVSYVTGAGNVLNSFDTFVVAPESLSSADELYEGAEATGNVALMIPTGDAGTIRVRPGFIADEVFFATS